MCGDVERLVSFEIGSHVVKASYQDVTQDCLECLTLCLYLPNAGIKVHIPPCSICVLGMLGVTLRTPGIWDKYSELHSALIFTFWGQVSLSRSGWPQIQQPVSDSQVLE